METRRELLVGAAAVFTAAPFSGQEFAAPQSARATVGLHRVVVDQRFASGRMFGAEAERLGQAVVRIDGDVTNLWFHDLAGLWSREAAPIAGLTTHRALLCLQMFAREHQMRPVFVAEHRANGDTVEHLLSGQRRAVDAHTYGEGAWPIQSARLMANLPSGGARAEVIASGRALGEDDLGTLFSWVIAPALRA